MHFIRCISPNYNKQKVNFEEIIVSNQLKTTCTMAYINFIRFGYSKSIAIDELARMCEPVDGCIKSCASRMRFYSIVLLSMGFQLDEFKMGKEAIFFRSTKFSLLGEYFRSGDSLKKIRKYYWRTRWRKLISAFRFLGNLFYRNILNQFVPTFVIYYDGVALF